MEAENEGKEVDLISEMKAIKNDVQVEVGSAEAATKAPEVLTDAPSPSPGSGPLPAPVPEPSPSPGTEPGAEPGSKDDQAVDTSVHKNAFTSLVIGIVAVVFMQ